MNGKVEVSVIVPCYRAGKYLPRFVETLKAQTFDGNWEAVFINDGDPDKSAYECIDDSRFRVIHSERKGVSAARNIGIENSSGEIVLFADPDDELGRDWMKHLANAMEGVDFAWAGCRVISDGEPKKMLPHDAGAVYRGDEVRRRTWRAVFGYTLGDIFRWWTPRRLWIGCRREFGSVCWRSFRRSVIEELRFDERLTLYEDSIFLSAYALKAKSLRIIDAADYDYFIRPEGCMSIQNKKREACRKFDLRDARRRLDPKMRHWRGSFILSAIEVLSSSGVRNFMRYILHRECI